MHHLIYLSYSHQLLSDEELATLLVHARYANHCAGITGVLLYAEGLFVQLLEGEKVALDQLYGRIAQDPRHYHLIKLVDATVAGRSFAEWSMAFEPRTTQQLKQLAGYAAADRLAAELPVLNAADAALLTLAKQFVFPASAD